MLLDLGVRVRLVGPEHPAADDPAALLQLLAPELPSLVGRIGVTSPAVVVIGNVAAFAADQLDSDPLTSGLTVLPDSGR